MKKERLIIVASVIGLAISAGAQSLTKEIKVDRDIVPEFRDADRLPISPVITLPAVSVPNLTYSLIDRPVGVTPSVFTLPVFNPAVKVSDVYPGYAAIGYMPTFNLGASAGYRFINTDKTRLGAWMQYNGRKYKNSEKGIDYLLPGDHNAKNSEHAASLGVNLSHRTTESSTLAVDVDYTYSHYDMFDLQDSRQGVNNINSSVSWNKESNEGLFYGIGAGFSRFAFINGNIYGSNPVRQNVMDINAQAGKNLLGHSKAMLGVDFSYVRTPDEINTSNTWLLRLTPGYRYAVNNLTLNIGLKIDMTHGAGKSFHVAPDVKIAYRPVNTFGVYVKAGGGEVQNTASSIYAVMPYVTQIVAEENSHIPVTLDGGIVFGPFKGGYLEIFGGWAKANEWLMPFRDNYMTITRVNVSGWHGGVALGYRYGSKFEAKLSAEAASGNNDISKAYYLWRDRAKYAINASAVYSPLAKLDLSASYTFRDKRKDGNFGLGAVNSFNLGAKYQITDRAGVFINGENLFNKSYYYIGHVLSQGITGLAGVTLKF